MNGVELIGEARRRRPEVKTLMVTARAYAPAAPIVGVPLLSKPFGPSDLARNVGRLLAES
jgi:hypothetical protein